MGDCAGRCARGVQRRVRQVEWLLLPASTWKVAHEAACIYHAMQTSGPRDELRIPTLRPIALGGCCGRPCRLNPRFDPPHAEAAYREHTKGAFGGSRVGGGVGARRRRGVDDGGRGESPQRRAPDAP